MSPPSSNFMPAPVVVVVFHGPSSFFFLPSYALQLDLRLSSVQAPVFAAALLSVVADTNKNNLNELRNLKIP